MHKHTNRSLIEAISMSLIIIHFMVLKYDCELRLQLSLFYETTCLKTIKFLWIVITIIKSITFIKR